MTMKSEIKLKRIKMANKILAENKVGTIASDVLNHALNTGTPWTDEVNEDIGDVHGNGKWLRTITKADQLYLTQNWERFDHRKQWRRLEQRVTATTGLYKELNQHDQPLETASYIIMNPRNNEAIRHIFKLRSGSSNLRGDKATRHLANTSICRHCGTFDETARHVFDQ